MSSTNFSDCSRMARTNSFASSKSTPSILAKTASVSSSISRQAASSLVSSVMAWIFANWLFRHPEADASTIVTPSSAITGTVFVPRNSGIEFIMPSNSVANSFGLAPERLTKPRGFRPPTHCMKEVTGLPRPLSLLTLIHWGASL